jgi:hypothetical protein
MLRFPVIGQDLAAIMAGYPVTGNIHAVVIAGYRVIGDKIILCEN